MADLTRSVKATLFPTEPGVEMRIFTICNAFTLGDFYLIYESKVYQAHSFPRLLNEVI